MRWRAVALALAACAVLCQGSSSRNLQQAATAPAPETESGACCAQLETLGWTGTLPVVILESSEPIPLESTVVLKYCTCPNGADFKSHEGEAKVGVRGNSSKKAAKKSYKMNTIHPNGTSDNLKFLGMPKENDWVLYGGDEVDLTLGMRNYLAYNLARGTGEYASRTVWFELFLVETGTPLTLENYNGIYIGEEKIKRDNDRVDIGKWTAENPSGGYLFAFENDNIKPDDIPVGPIPGMENPFVLSYPKDEPAAVTWLAKYLTDLQTALFADTWLDARDGYTRFVDGPSWVDYFLFVELSKNPDGYRGSTYMHKDVDKPLAMGPAWDYNEAFGECCGFPFEGYEENGKSEPGIAGGSAISPNGWRFLICADKERCVFDPYDGISGWFRRVWNDTRFREAAATRFAELRASNWTDAKVSALINDAVQEVEPAILRDFGKWSKYTLKDWYATPEIQFTTEVQDLETWTLQRLAWMEAALEKAASPTYSYPKDNQIPVPGAAAPAAAATAG